MDIVYSCLNFLLEQKEQKIQGVSTTFTIKFVYFYVSVFPLFSVSHLFFFFAFFFFLKRAFLNHNWLTVENGGIFPRFSMEYFIDDFRVSLRNIKRIYKQKCLMHSALQLTNQQQIQKKHATSC